jgi:xanthine dehydrogenase accessory factor
MSFDLDALRAAVAAHGRVARVVVAEAKGSAPREAGASMLVWDGGQSGTIGGGALEWEAAARARELLVKGGAKLDRLALGPALQQCCGGAVTLLTEVWDEAGLAALVPEAGLVARAVERDSQLPLAVKRRLQAARGQGVTGGPALIQGWMVEPLDRPRQQLWVWGAGHVGRAVVGVLAPMPELSITWVDTAESRFPEAIPDGVEQIVAADPAALVRFAPEGAEHLILTFSHALDLALCHALLSHGFARAGLIGSATKWARFRKRLSELGHEPRDIARIDCPIGDPRLGKHPQAIAISVAAAILGRIGAATSAKEGAG